MRTTITIEGTIDSATYDVPVIAIQRGPLALHPEITSIHGQTGSVWVISHVATGRAVWSEDIGDEPVHLVRSARLLRRLSDEINWCALFPDYPNVSRSRRRYVGRLVKRIVADVMRGEVKE